MLNSCERACSVSIKSHPRSVVFKDSGGVVSSMILSSSNFDCGMIDWVNALAKVMGTMAGLE